jgi:Leucine-rich repeat (LRR) protein
MEEHPMRRLVPAALALLLVAGLIAAQDKPPQRSDAEKEAIKKLVQLNVIVLDIAQNDPHLDVSYLQKDAKFSNAFLTPLKDLKSSLVHLNLRGQDVTDAQMVHLKDLTNLARLHLENTKVTDKGLEQIKGLTNLVYLNLYGDNITDAGLVNLEGMKKLKNVYLWQTKVTDAGAAKLKKALPQLDIDRGLEAEKPPEKPAEKPKEGTKPPEKPKDKPKEEKKPDAKKDEKKDEKKPDAKKDDKPKQ